MNKYFHFILPHDRLLLRNLRDLWAVGIDEAPSTVGDVVVDGTLQVAGDGQLGRTVQLNQLVAK